MSLLAAGNKCFPIDLTLLWSVLVYFVITEDKDVARDSPRYGSVCLGMQVTN